MLDFLVKNISYLKINTDGPDVNMGMKFIGQSNKPIVYLTRRQSDVNNMELKMRWMVLILYYYLISDNCCFFKILIEKTEFIIWISTKLYNLHQVWTNYVYLQLNINISVRYCWSSIIILLILRMKMVIRTSTE